jgi:myo-inositol-1(or 4)-monophosphatase
LSERLEFAIEAAQQTGQELLNRYFTGNSQGQLKSDRTLVTEADHAADQLLNKLIQDRFPDDGILSEEANTVLPGTAHSWIVDPLDGTINFSLGLLYWGISIAHLEDGFPQSACLFFPATDELFTAENGKGAYLNGKPLRVKDQTSDRLVPVFVHCSRMHQRYQVNLPYKQRSLGAAAYHLCLVANNKAVLAFESTPRIWDFAASWQIVKEAGGAIESFGAEHPFPAKPGMDYHRTYYPIAAGASEQVLMKAREGIHLHQE